MTRSWKAELDMRRDMASLATFREARRILVVAAERDDVDIESFKFTVNDHLNPDFLTARADGFESAASALHRAFTANIWSGL